MKIHKLNVALLFVAVVLTMAGCEPSPMSKTFAATKTAQDAIKSYADKILGPFEAIGENLAEFKSLGNQGMENPALFLDPSFCASLVELNDETYDYLSEIVSIPAPAGMEKFREYMIEAKTSFGLFEKNFKNG